MSEAIALSVPNLSGNELEYVSRAVESGWVSTAGSYVTQFENVIANYVGLDDAVACQSGTAGLHLSLISLGIEAGDEVIVPTLTFIAAVNPVRYLSAFPVFMDCDDTLCLDPKKLKMFCEKCCILQDGVLINKETGRKIKAVVVVHVFGNMADMEEIAAIAKQYNLKILEDATEALGTRYESGCFAGMYAGTIGDMGVYSFNGNKLITTGGGGMVVSRDAPRLNKVRHLSTQAKSDELYYEHDAVGFNYRLTNLQAALGVAQMEQVENFITAKNENYHRYANCFFGNKNAKLMPFRDGVRSNRWFYSLLLPSHNMRDELIRKLSAAGVQTRPIWGLIHEQIPYALSMAYEIQKANFYRERIVNIPCSTSLSKTQVDLVASLILKEIDS